MLFPGNVRACANWIYVALQLCAMEKYIVHDNYFQKSKFFQPNPICVASIGCVRATIGPT